MTLIQPMHGVRLPALRNLARCEVSFRQTDELPAQQKDVFVGPASLVSTIRLLWLCRPKCDRRLYRAVRQLKPTRLVELGLGDGMRARRLISLAQRYTASATIEYTAIDLFEARRNAVVTLKQAHRQLVHAGARVRLLPGDPDLALPHSANVLSGTDLLVIDITPPMHDLRHAWFYLPRMLHEQSLVVQYQRPAGQAVGLKFVQPDEIHRRAAAAREARTAA